MPVLFFMHKLPPTSRAEAHRHTVIFFLVLELMCPCERPKDVLVCFGDAITDLAWWFAADICVGRTVGLLFSFSASAVKIRWWNHPVQVRAACPAVMRHGAIGATHHFHDIGCRLNIKPTFHPANRHHLIFCF